MASFWTRCVHHNCCCLISLVLIGPTSLFRLSFLQLVMNRCIHAPILNSFGNGYLSSNSSKTSVSLIATARICLVNFASALLSGVASSRLSGGHSDGLLNHDGPFLHNSLARPFLPGHRFLLDYWLLERNAR